MMIQRHFGSRGGKLFSSKLVRRRRPTTTTAVASAAWLSSAAASSSSIVVDGGEEYPVLTTSELTNRCNRHIVESPYPPIASGPHAPFFEFMTATWNSDKQKDRIAILDGSTGDCRTFGQWRSRAGQLAAALLTLDSHRDLNHESSDSSSGGSTTTVALYSPNHVDYVTVALGVSATGAKLTPVNPLFTEHELVRVLRSSHASVLIAHESKLDVVTSVVRNNSCPDVKRVVVLPARDDDKDDGGETTSSSSSTTTIPFGTIHFEDLLRSTQDCPQYETVSAVQRDTWSHPLLVPYSSGTTTGLPKGVCISHGNLVANVLQAATIEAAGGGGSSTDNNIREDVPGEKVICPLPFFHIYGFTVALLWTAYTGRQMITVSEKFCLETFCQLVQEHQPVKGYLVPPIFLQLAADPVVDQYDLSSLRMLVSGAAPLSKETELAIERRTGAAVKQSWGMSELSPLGTCNSDDNYRSGSVGPLVPSTVAKVVDDAGNSLGPGETGELLIQGPQVMMGYWKEPEKTAETMCPDTKWLRTGDVAHYDDDGYIYITDRMKELIKVRGYPVAPAELEALLLSHDAVVDAAVIAVPDDRSGELPRAYVVLKDDETMTSTTASTTGTDDNDKDMKRKEREELLYRWTKERVAPYKRLDGGIIFVDAIPKSPSGKILRRVLRDQVREEME